MFLGDEQPTLLNGTDHDTDQISDMEDDVTSCTWINEKTIRKIEQTFIDDQGLISHQMRSFDDFMNRGIQNFMDNMPEIEILPNKSSFSEKKCRHVKLRFTKVHVSKPDVSEKDGDARILLPNEAMCRNFTYSSKVEVDVNVKVCLSIFFFLT
jgi:DNA-directed RNA polymerase beta subunit